MPRGTYGLDATNAKIAELNSQLEQALRRLRALEALALLQAPTTKAVAGNAGA